MATGTVSITQQKFVEDALRPVRRATFAWTSTAGGAAGDTSLFKVSGEILKVQFIPGTSSNQPTDLYDVTITDENSVDILAGQGANLSNSANSQVIPGIPLKDGTTTSVGLMTVDDYLTLSVTNAGNAKSGTVIVFYR